MAIPRFTTPQFTPTVKADTVMPAAVPSVQPVQPAPSSCRTPLPPTAAGSAILGTYKRAPVEFTGGEGVYLHGSDGRATSTS